MNSKAETVFHWEESGCYYLFTHYWKTKFPGWGHLSFEVIKVETFASNHSIIKRNQNVKVTQTLTGVIVKI
jgi:hypothetical protein